MWAWILFCGLVTVYRPAANGATNSKIAVADSCCVPVQAGANLPLLRPRVNANDMATALRPFPCLCTAFHFLPSWETGKICFFITFISQTWPSSSWMKNLPPFSRAYLMGP